MANGGDGTDPGGMPPGRDRAWLRRKVDEALHGSWTFFVRFVVLVVLGVWVFTTLAR